MNNRDRPSPAPPLGDVLKQALAIAARFDPRKTVFLKRNGEWGDFPKTSRERVSHELFYQLKTSAAGETERRLESLLSPFVEDDTWNAAVALATVDAHPPPGDRTVMDEPFLLLHESLIWIMEREIHRRNAAKSGREWDREARTLQAECRRRLDLFEDEKRRALDEDESRAFEEAAARVRGIPWIELLISQLAEETRLSDSLERLLAAAADSARKEEILSAIADHIQPPMGIVTNLSPAVLFPCLRLLLDPRLEVESGIPYLASVVLSILGDARSSQTLLHGLKRFPLNVTKIRENLIYALGNLGEAEAVELLGEVLDAPDEFAGQEKDSGPAVLLLEQKEEAIWALGKTGLASVRALPSLVRYADHPSARLKTYLAWTLGEIGWAQKEASGGLSADLVIALLKLLKEKDRPIFEEAVSGLKKIGLPDFIHSLYLYHVGAVNILGLKPAERGLYELSETLHHLLRTKPKVVIAVNGDSGTGKTYFCQAIAGGFAGLRPSEILYLMRDAKKGQKIFNRLLGLPWLKKHIDPSYYHDDPLLEEEDDPETFFRKFLEEQADKRLIILDGCRDRYYFQRIIDFFYNQGKLDIEVNFRANFSTRRLNLEEREVALESVKLHLAFLEEPPLEDTSFYQDGLVILYDLDNSTAARLNSEETRELFEERRIDSWGEFIRVGGFSAEEHPLQQKIEGLRYREEGFRAEEEDWPSFKTGPFVPVERRLKPTLNPDLESSPNLLETVPLDDIKPHRLRFYAQDQVAGIGKGGLAFVLTFLDHRVFSTSLEGVGDFVLLGRDFYLAAPGRGFFRLSFERNDFTVIDGRAAAIDRLASFPPDIVVGAQADGRIRVWNFLEKRLMVLTSAPAPLLALAIDQRGRIWTGSGDTTLRCWDMERGKMITVEGLSGPVRFIRTRPGGRILTVEDAPNMKDTVFRWVDIDARQSTATTASLPGRVNGVTLDFSGRVIVALGGPAPETKNRSGETLAVLTLHDDACFYQSLSGHSREAADCLTMGPRIISCGLEENGRSTIRVWGSDFYVRTELGKRLIRP